MIIDEINKKHKILILFSRNNRSLKYFIIKKSKKWSKSDLVLFLNLFILFIELVYCQNTIGLVLGNIELFLNLVFLLEFIQVILRLDLAFDFINTVCILLQRNFLLSGKVHFVPPLAFSVGTCNLLLHQMAHFSLSKPTFLKNLVFFEMVGDRVVGGLICNFFSGTL